MNATPMKPAGRKRFSCYPLLAILVVITSHEIVNGDDELFREQIAPVLSRKCLACHGGNDPKGDFSVQSAESFLAGDFVTPGDAKTSYLIDLITPENGFAAMPRDSAPLNAAEIAAFRQWIDNGARWPEGVDIGEAVVENTDWWSYQPLSQPPVPEITSDWPTSVIDKFILAELAEHNLTPSPAADRRTLIRRLYFDLTGLPPDFETVESFVSDDDPYAYEKLVDELLASPHYGEKWARHWLDVVHYGDTHGYDKDKPRPNAWPYRDYVIRSFNDDKPYGRFVMEQIAGDVLWPGTRDGIEATGFISAGPWDFIGHAEVPETKLDGKIARNLDRDDMVSSTMNTFISTTVHCARCHNHKFDPVTQEHYYSLQAVFAAIDRSDREYDIDPAISRLRSELRSEEKELVARRTVLESQIRQLAGEQLTVIDERLSKLAAEKEQGRNPAFGYHSAIGRDQWSSKWVQVDLGRPVAIHRITLAGCDDDFAGIGKGFGFPVRFRIEGSNDPEFAAGVILITDQTKQDFTNPETDPVHFYPGTPEPVRYIRLTATKLAERQNDFIMAIGEMLAIDADGHNVAMGRPVTALDSIEAPPRWQRSGLVDGVFVANNNASGTRSEVEKLHLDRQCLISRVVPCRILSEASLLDQEIEATRNRLANLPPPSLVYCGCIHAGEGTFVGTGHNGGRPREIRVLHRGDIQSAGAVAAPGTVPLIRGIAWQFDLPAEHNEGDRRAALARWLVRHDNPLTWRSIVNRIWLYHFGRGIVDSPNDFGRMGELPTHPGLLDWLAAEFRDGRQSFRDLHRMIVTSSTYRQSSLDRDECRQIDGDNRYLWKMNRRVLDAEAVRDATLKVSGQLDTRLFGPPFRDFVIEQPENSPHYEYDLHDPNDPASHRRSIYRHIVRSQPQPFMQTLDCADPSESVAKRDTTLTSLQALTMMNNRFMLAMSGNLAKRAESSSDDVASRIRFVFREALAREPGMTELEPLIELERQHGMAHVCRVVLNLNEFVFVD